MKKKYRLNILLLLLVLIISACEEEVVQPFSAERGINFIATDGSDKDTYTLLDRTADFLPHYKKGQFDFEYDTLNVLVRLEGTFSDLPLKVNVKALPVEGYATPELVMPETSIKPGTAIDTIKIYSKHLAYLDSTYKAQIVFDYEKTDLVPGVKERQQFILSVIDKFPLEDFMYVSDEAEWNEEYSYLLGLYGQQKVRLIYSVLQGSGTIFYYYFYYGTDNYIKGKIPEFKAALDAYNEKHKDNPLKEDDGRLVTFD